MLVACLSALVLTSCGADVNTQLEIHDDFSGTRAFVLTMTDADADRLSGGIDAAEQVLDNGAPEMLSFEGVQAEDEGYSATFTMSFDDLSDYQEQINALLDASNVAESDRQMNLEVDEQHLFTSVLLEEDFYNDDLMRWASTALIDKEIVDANSTVLTTSGSARVVFNGEEIETSTSLPRISFSFTDDHRFRDIDLDVDLAASGETRIMLTYEMSPNSDPAQKQFLDDRITQLQALDGATEVAENSDVSTGVERREIAATFSSAQATSAGLQILLANDEASFKVTELSDNESPDVVMQYAGENWTCDTICDPTNLQLLDGETTYPDQWQLQEERRGEGKFFLEFNQGMPLDSLTSTTQLEFNGDLQQRLEFVVDNKTQHGHEDSVAELFKPPENIGSFHSTVQDAKTIYTTTFREQTAEDLTNTINSYLESKDIEETASIGLDPRRGFWPSYDLQVDLSPIWELAPGRIEERATFEVELPPLHSGDSDAVKASGQNLTMEDSTGTFVVSASGPTATTVWVTTIALLLAAALVTVLIRTRKAATRVWGVAPIKTEDARAYNVQGPNDALTESEIFQAPLAPILQNDTSHETTNLAGASTADKVPNRNRPKTFPDLPVPSNSDYQELQQRLDANDESEDHDVLDKPKEDEE